MTTDLRWDGDLTWIVGLILMQLNDFALAALAGNVDEKDTGMACAKLLTVLQLPSNIQVSLSEGYPKMGKSRMSGKLVPTIIHS